VQSFILSIYFSTDLQMALNQYPADVASPNTLKDQNLSIEISEASAKSKQSTHDGGSKGTLIILDIRE
jgi:hypothetical protein